MSRFLTWTENKPNINWFPPTYTNIHYGGYMTTSLNCDSHTMRIIIDICSKYDNLVVAVDRLYIHIDIRRSMWTPQQR